MLLFYTDQKQMSAGSAKRNAKILEDEVYKQQAMSEDEIKRFTIDEGLTECQRCLVLLKKQDHEQ